MKCRWCTDVFVSIFHQLTFSRLSNRASCNRSLPNNFLRLLILITIFFINHYLRKTKVKEEMFLSLFITNRCKGSDWTEVYFLFFFVFKRCLCVGSHPGLVLIRGWEERTETASVHFNLSRVSTISFFRTNSDFFTKCRWWKNGLMVIVTQVCYLKLSWGSSPFHCINCLSRSWCKKLSSPFSPPSLLFVHPILKSEKQRIICRHIPHILNE